MVNNQSSEKTIPSLTRGVRDRAVFHRFCRGGYAIFASLHREVRIGVLTVSMLVSVNIPKVQALQITAAPASDDEPEDKELAEVSVAGTMSPLTALQAARIVGVITRQQIEASAAQSVNDLLKSAVGVDVRQRGGFGIQTDISINGGTFDQITLLLNGVNISSPHTGHLAADFPVSLSDIERIEILEGAASRVYGASAFGGAINIVTKAPPVREESGWRTDSTKINQFDFDAGLQGGSYSTFGGDARIAFSSRKPLLSKMGGGGGGSSLSFAYLRSSGATVNSDFSRANAYLRGCYDHTDFTVDWQAGYSHKSYGANTFYSAAYPNQYERNSRFIISVGAETKGRVHLRPEVYWHRLYDNFELIRGTTTGENFHRTDVHGVRLTAAIRWALGRTALGAEIREEGIYSTTLGQPLADISRHCVPHEEDVYYTHHDSRTNFSFNLEHNILLPRFTASFGLLANKNTRFDDHLRFYPGIDLAVTPAPRWRLFASYNKGFRLPTFTDLYYKSPTHEGNQGMQAEESHSFQLGTTITISPTSLYGGERLRTENRLKMKKRPSIQNGGGAFTLKLFYHRGHNLIDWVMYAPDDIYHSANFNLDNMGVQAEANWRFSSFIMQNSPLTLNLSYAFIHQRRHDDPPVYKSNYAMEYLRHKLVVRLDHMIWSTSSRQFPSSSKKRNRGGALSASWNLRWQNRMGSYIRYENAQSTGELVPYKPYATLDLKLRWTAPRYELWAEGSNLFNRRYYDLGNVPQPGIVVLAGVRVKFSHTATHE